MLSQKNSGFSLLELAMVLAIVGFIMGGLLPTLSTQVDIQRIKDTRKQLEEVKDALIGFAAANGRLPCPASTTSNGYESFCTSASPGCGTETFYPTAAPAHGNCKYPHDGLVPAVTLGLSPVDSQGYMVDAWSNRIHYAVTTVLDLSNNNKFTGAATMKGAGIASLNGDLYVCASSPNPGSPSQSIANCGA